MTQMRVKEEVIVKSLSVKLREWWCIYSLTWSLTKQTAVVITDEQTNQQPCSFCDEVDTPARDFSPPAKDRSPADPQQWMPNASWSRLKPQSACM